MVVVPTIRRGIQMALVDPEALKLDEALDQALQAGKRWRAEQRAAPGQIEAAEAGRVGNADSPERMRKNAHYLVQKLDRTGISVPNRLKSELRKVAEAADEPTKDLDTTFAERVIGETRDFLAAAFLEGGVLASRSVGRIVVPMGAGGSPSAPVSWFRATVSS